MNFRTEIILDPAGQKISCNDPTMLIGSCFSASIGERLDSGYFPVMVNPFGTVYNPVSVLAVLKRIATNKRYELNELYNNKGIWLSFDHNTEFSSDNSELTLGRINEALAGGTIFLSKTKYLFITFGTARIYRFRNTGAIVSNCHKIPDSEFTKELLSPDQIISEWEAFLPEFYRKFPGITIVFTISPVRHWKDGALMNQLSKSTLFLAVKDLMHLFPSAGYFPAYELFMDDLRDYRFYADDLLHPSEAGIDYVWEKFTGAYFDDATRQLWNEAARIRKAVRHKVPETGTAAIKDFAKVMLEKISRIEALMPLADFSGDKEYFRNLL
jgi:hypothetical protein